MENNRTLLERVLDNSTDFNELDAVEWLIEHREETIARQAELIGAALQGEKRVDDIVLGIVIETLDDFFASGHPELTLDLLTASVRVACDKYKLTGSHTTIRGKANSALRYGLGGLMPTDHVNSYGDKLYVFDASKMCATQDRGKYVVKSNNVFKAVRARYASELRGINLVSPKMYKAKAEAEPALKRNISEFEDDWEKKLSKVYDDHTLRVIARALEQDKLERIKEAREARKVAA